MIQQKSATCKKCGATIPASDLARDPSQLICRLCVAKAQPIGGIRTTTTGQSAVKSAPAPQAVRPSSYLDRAAEREESRSEEKMRVKCKKCSFAFNYNVEKGVPKNCPYCKTPVSN